MFTGLVEESGKIRQKKSVGTGLQLRVEAREVLSDLKIGDSISVNGVCLTVTERGNDWFEAHLVPETLARSSLGELNEGDYVNLERPLRSDARLGGHIVQGHVDQTAVIAEIRSLEDGSHWIEVELTGGGEEYLVEKGSIAVEGISLTLAKVIPSTEGKPARFCLAIIPHTWAVTHLSKTKVGQKVNIEFDVMAKHFYRLIQPYLAGIKQEIRKTITEGSMR